MRPEEELGGLPPEVDGAVVTVGTFDGVHRGHGAVLGEIEERARRRGLCSIVVTFDRHPLTVVRPEDAPPLLTLPEEKLEVLAQYELDYVSFLPFTRSLSLYQPEEFVRYVLVDRFRVRELVVGHDHGFGRSRSGDRETLRRLGRELGFDVDVVPEVELAGVGPVSSTRIRKQIEQGRVDEVARALGRPYALSGPVVHGRGQGRKLGFPTANIRPPAGAKLVPGGGVYLVRATVRSQFRDGLVHLGPRPTFPGAAASLELYLLDFEGDLYGETVKLEFLERLRDIRGFASTDELVRQMERDREQARRFFGEGGAE